VLIPHATAAAQALVLALALAPLALAAAISPSFRVAPFSAVIVLLIGGDIGASPIMSAVTRVSEVALGGLVAVAVSLLVFPERAHRLGLEAAAGILRKMADLRFRESRPRRGASASSPSRASRIRRRFREPC
jgi:uncharacterized membrane protein YccC